MLDFWQNISHLWCSLTKGWFYMFREKIPLEVCHWISRDHIAIEMTFPLKNISSVKKDIENYMYMIESYLI